MTAIHTVIGRTVANIWLPALILSCVAFAPAVVLGQRATGDPWVAPERAAQRTNPVPSDDGSVKSGRQLFERNCLKCHGKAGHGDGPQAQFLNPTPSDLTSEAARGESDGALFWKISEGRGLMPKLKLNDKERWTLIRYLRALQGKS